MTNFNISAEELLQALPSQTFWGKASGDFVSLFQESEQSELELYLLPKVLDQLGLDYEREEHMHGNGDSFDYEYKLQITRAEYRALTTK